MTGTCPECEGSIVLNDPMRGEIATCPKCNVDLEVTSLNPVTLDLIVVPEDCCE